MVHPTKPHGMALGARARWGRVAVLGLVAWLSASCATVKPQDRAILSDPVMQFEGDPQASAQRQHATDNREGSWGGQGVSGGGCGCN